MQSGWYFFVWRGKTEFVGLAKRQPFVNGHPLMEPGDVWFEFGRTPEEALAAVKRSIAH